MAIANVAAAQTEIRAIYGMLDQIGAALDALNDQAELGGKVDRQVIQLVLGDPGDVTNT